MGFLNNPILQKFKMFVNQFDRRNDKLWVDSLSKLRVDEPVEDRDEDENHERIDNLHLVRFDDEAAQLPGSSDRLEGPSRSLLVKKSPENWNGDENF